ncbi:DUF2851 family protein [Balneolaceae bacterium ANBcel3]|nr:DUF2851 family protein [Balneolaceae bacterium ANBcel3]
MNIINERFFHFLWENLHFSAGKLKTTCGKDVHVIHPGTSNKGDGPDYTFAHLRFDTLSVYGDIELHLHNNDWYHHGHHKDPVYNRVILHVIPQYSRRSIPAASADNTRIPTLELLPYLPEKLFQLWKRFQLPDVLPCAGLMKTMPSSVFSGIVKQWDSRYFEYRCSRLLSDYPAGTKMHLAWNYMVTLHMTEGLGYYNNRQNMRLLGMELVKNKRYSSLYNEKVIQETTRFLFEKAGLSEPVSSQSILQKQEWDLSSTRPNNRPEVRIPQAAELYFRLKSIPLSTWINEPTLSLWEKISRFQFTAPIGKNRLQTLFVNTLLPAVYLLAGWLHQRDKSIEALSLWEQQRIPIPPFVRKKFKASNFPDDSLYNRLSGLHHYRYHCQPRKCEDCEVMKYLVKT